MSRKRVTVNGCLFSELRLVLVLRVVCRAACAFCGGCLLYDLWAAWPTAATGQRGDGRQLRLASPTGEGVHGSGHTQPAPAPGRRHSISTSLQMWHLFVIVIANNTNVCMSNEAVQSSSNLWSKPSSPKVKICWKSLDQILNNDLFWFDPHLLALNLSKTTFSLRSEDWLLSHLLHRKGVAYLYLRLSRSYLTAP